MADKNIWDVLSETARSVPGAFQKKTDLDNWKTIQGYQAAKAERDFGEKSRHDQFMRELAEQKFQLDEKMLGYQYDNLKSIEGLRGAQARQAGTAADYNVSKTDTAGDKSDAAMADKRIKAIGMIQKWYPTESLEEILKKHPNIFKNMMSLITTGVMPEGMDEPEVEEQGYLGNLWDAIWGDTQKPPPSGYKIKDAAAAVSESTPTYNPNNPLDAAILSKKKN